MTTYNWNWFYNSYKNTFPAIEECIKKRLIDIAVDPKTGIEAFVKNNTLLSIDNSHAANMVRRCLDEGPASIYELYITMQIVKKGPIVFQPEKFDFKMLEEMDINIGFDDYNQPFETIIIELPQDYGLGKIVDCPQSNDMIYLMQHGVVPAKHSPFMVVLHHWKNRSGIIAAVYLTSGMSIKCLLYNRGGNDYTIDDDLKSCYQKDREMNGFEMSPEEDELSTRVIKAALNYALLIDEVGSKRLGYKNPSYVNKLRGYIRKKNKQNDRRELKMLPVYYTLNQEVQLYKSVSSNGSYQPTGKVIGPHRRRGYYKMQPHGPGNTLRKRIRIPPTFVNAHLFLGQMKDATSTYKS